MRRAFLLVLCALALPLASAEATSGDDEAVYRVEREIWIVRFAGARARVALAHTRQQRALDDYARTRHRRRQRGAAKLAVMNELTAAGLEVDAAESNLAALLERARRAGIPKGWMRERRGAAPAARADPP
ncbi:MAG: hypothetical protein ACE5FL_15375 [Myxococcota bacterium]